MPPSRPSDHSPARRLDAIGLSWLALTIALFLAIRPGWEQPGRIPREYVLVAGVALIALVRLARGQGTRLASPPAWLALIFGLGGLAGLAGVAAEARGDVLWALAPLMAAWGAALLAGGAEDALPGLGATERGLARGAILGCGLAGALALAQSYLGLDLLPQVRQPAATFMHRNVLGQALVLALPLALGAAASARGHVWRWVAFGSAALGAAALVATRSRGSWIALSLGLLLVLTLALARRARVTRSLGAGFALVALAASAAALVAPPEARRLPSVVRSVELLAYPGESSVTTRVALAANTLRMAAAAPLAGHGAGRFGAEYPLFHEASRPTPGFGLEKRPEHAHNEFLHAAAELGIPAALALALLLGGGLLRSIGGALRDPRPHVALWQGASAAALLGVLVHAQASFPLRSPTSACLAFALAGVAWRGERTKKASARRASLSRLPVEIVLVLLLAPALAAWPYDAARQSALGESLDAYATGDAARAAELAREPARHRFRSRTRGLATMILFETERDVASTRPLLEGALAADPHNLNLLLATGARRLKAGDAPAALDAFRHALEIEGGLGRAWLGVAMAGLETGDRAAASRACVRALLSEPVPAAAELFCAGNGLLPRGPGTPADSD